MITPDCINTIRAAGSLQPVRLSKFQVETYSKAFVHKGAVSNIQHSYEILEFVGDSVYHLVLSDYLMNRYPECDENQLSTIRCSLINGAVMASVGKRLRFDLFVSLSKNGEVQNVRNRNKILEDVFEAFIGAIFKCEGFDAAYQWVVAIIERYINISDWLEDRNQYREIINTSHPGKNFTFTRDSAGTIAVSLRDNEGKLLSLGFGTTKKDAENDAARNFLVKAQPR